jgi:hypothetical protein
MGGMTCGDMEEFFRQSFEDLLRLRRLKSGEYSEESDALSNFRRNAKDLGVEMETVWRVYAHKHWDALSLYLRDVQQGTTRERSEPIEGRIDDLLVYLLLLKAILREREGGTDRRRAANAVSRPPADGGLPGGGDSLLGPRGA